MPLLFLLCIEPLAQYIRSDNTIEGITYRSSSKKISLIVDDVLVTIKADEHAFAHQDDILSKFALILGLTINRDKSVITSIGKHCDPLLSAINYKWSNGQFHYLGFLLSEDDRNIASLNVDPMIFDFEDCVRYHKCLLYPYGVE